MRLFRRFRVPVYTVQLHRIVTDEDFEVNPDREWRIAYSWQPIQVRGLHEARQEAWKLRSCNKWSTTHARPHVTIIDAHGEEVSEI